MVQWKGKISEEKSGGRASRLDSIENFQVPNFFTLTRKETKQLIGEAETQDEILKQEASDKFKEKIKDAYDDINVSSEVRNASGKARNLVEGQRNGGRVSVRISGDKHGVYLSKINVGSSDIVDAIKEVVASYFEAEEQEEYPAVIVQRMIEAEASGAAINSYLGNYQLFEAVKGLGTALEEAETVPDVYLLKDQKIIEKDIPDQQLETQLNPMSGEPRKKQVRRHKSIFRDSEIKKLFGKLDSSELNIKFAYKRGTFYIVDAFKTDNNNPFNSKETSLDGIRVSKGKIEGTIGEDIILTDKPKINDGRPLITGKGGYTSTMAQRARNNDIPAIFRYKGELKDRQKVFSEPKSVKLDKRNTKKPEYREKQSSSQRKSQQFKENKQGRKQNKSSDTITEVDEVNATEVVPLNSGRGLYLQPPFRGRYAVTESRDKNAISPNSFLKSYSDIFAHEGDEAILDVRNLDRSGVENAINYLESDLKILVLNRADRVFIEAAVRNDFDAIAVNPGALDQTKRNVAEAEKQFIIDKLREL